MEADGGGQGNSGPRFSSQRKREEWFETFSVGEKVGQLYREISDC